mgnify:CR=1 FL=1
MYCPQDPIPIRYILARVIREMKFGDPSLWELSKKIEEKEIEQEQQMLNRHGHGSMFKY